MAKKQRYRCYFHYPGQSLGKWEMWKFQWQVQGWMSEYPMVSNASKSQVAHWNVAQRIQHLPSIPGFRLPDTRWCHRLLEFYESQQIPSGGDMIQFPLVLSGTKKWGWSEKRSGCASAGLTCDFFRFRCWPLRRLFWSSWRINGVALSPYASNQWATSSETALADTSDNAKKS